MCTLSYIVIHGPSWSNTLFVTKWPVVLHCISWVNVPEEWAIGTNLVPWGYLMSYLYGNDFKMYLFSYEQRHTFIPKGPRPKKCLLLDYCELIDDQLSRKRTFIFIIQRNAHTFCIFSKRCTSEQYRYPGNTCINNIWLNYGQSTYRPTQCTALVGGAHVDYIICSVMLLLFDKRNSKLMYHLYISFWL